MFSPVCCMIPDLLQLWALQFWCTVSVHDHIPFLPAIISIAVRNYYAVLHVKQVTILWLSHLYVAIYEAVEIPEELIQCVNKRIVRSLDVSWNHIYSCAVKCLHVYCTKCSIWQRMTGKLLVILGTVTTSSIADHIGRAAVCCARCWFSNACSHAVFHMSTIVLCKMQWCSGGECIWQRSNWGWDREQKTK